MAGIRRKAWEWEGENPRGQEGQCETPEMKSEFAESVADSEPMDIAQWWAPARRQQAGSEDWAEIQSGAKSSASR